jgi:glycosyltransferase involved in cell wall biosynthesis
VKILLLVHQYPPDHIGGTELYTQTLAQALVRRGHQVTVLCRGATPGVGLQQSEENGVVVWRAPASPSTNGRFLATFGDAPARDAFQHVLQEASPDRVHVQHLIGFPVSVLHSLRERGIPFAITLHDYWWVCANAQLLTNYSGQLCDGPRAYLNCARCALARAGRGSLWPAVPPAAWVMSWRGRQLRSALLQADQVIAPSSFVQVWYNAHCIPEKRIEVLPHGLEWPPGLQRTRSPAELVRLLYLGGLAWQKGVHVLLEAFGRVSGAAELWIAGDESFDPAYVERLQAQASPRVRFLGSLNRERMWEVLSQVDLLTVPSLWHETFSLVTHEAFAAGVPVIASRVGAMSEAVQDGVNGLLLPPGDVNAWQVALQRLVNEPGLIEGLRTNVHPPLTLDAHVQRLESLLRS